MLPCNATLAGILSNAINVYQIVLLICSYLSLFIYLIKKKKIYTTMKNKCTVCYCLMEQIAQVKCNEVIL